MRFLRLLFALTACVNQFFLCVTNAVVAEDSNPVWIWGSENANQSALDGQCEFRKTFELDEPSSAQLEITCDNRYVVRLNGRFVGMDAQWNQMHRYDVSAALRTGENEIYVRAKNDDVGPAGLLVKLSVAMADGSQRIIVSDDSWQAKMQLSGTWDPTAQAREPYRQSFAVASFTADATPWGTNVTEATETIKLVKAAAPADGPLQLQDGDKIIWLGNTLIERAQRADFLESAITSFYPDRKLTFRNLGWSGDTVFGHARARFDSVQDGFDHLETHVQAEQPTVLFVNYGANAAHEGQAGLPQFVEGYHQLLDVLEVTGARIVLLSPIRHENMGPPLPDPTSHNKHLAAYSQAIKEIAEQRKLYFIDLFHKLPSDRQLTYNGIHLTDEGYQAVAQVILSAMDPPAEPWRIVIDANRDRKPIASAASIEQIVRDGQQVAFTITDERLPLAKTSPDQATGRMLQVRGLPPGNYQLTVDGQPIMKANHQQWQAGVELPGGPEFQQVEQLRQTIAKKNELYFHRWRPENETYLFLFRKHEQGNNAVEIPQFDPLIEEQEKQVQQLVQPQSHRYEIAPTDE